MQLEAAGWKESSVSSELDVMATASEVDAQRKRWATPRADGVDMAKVHLGRAVGALEDTGNLLQAFAPTYQSEVSALL